MNHRRRRNRQRNRNRNRNRNGRTFRLVLRPGDRLVVSVRNDD